MQTLVLENVRPEQGRKRNAFSIIKWYKEHEPALEMNRFGLTAALVLLQVSIAGFNVVIPALAGASVWIMAPGIAMAFLSNSIAFAQMNMKWVLAGFALSMLINGAISLYFLFQIN
jgi:hypothetical protein